MESSKMPQRTSRVVLGVFSLLLAPHVEAGLLDSPPPTINGAVGEVIYRMGPVYYHPGQVDTVVKCTNLNDAQAVLVVEVFDQGDNPVGTLVQAALSVGGTVNFVTSADTSRNYWVVIPDLPPLDHGKARVSATTAKLSCTGYHRTRTAGGTTDEKTLELIKKVSRAPSVLRQ